MVKIFNYIYYNFSLAALFNSYDGYINGNGYSFYLSQKVIIAGEIATIYHRWCGPLGEGLYCAECEDGTCIWDLTQKDMLPLTDASKLIYEI